MSELEAREKLHKLALPKDIQESAKRIINCCIRGQDTITGITDKFYAMGEAIEKMIEIDPKRRKEETQKQKIKKLEQNRKKVRGFHKRTGEADFRDQ